MGYSNFEKLTFSPSEAALRARTEFRVIPVANWWFELAKYRFMISPIGAAIQSAKTFEALFVCTVPIIVRMTFVLFDDLVAMGFPIVVLDSIQEVTLENTT